MIKQVWRSIVVALILAGVSRAAPGLFSVDPQNATGTQRWYVRFSLGYATFAMANLNDYYFDAYMGDYYSSTLGRQGYFDDNLSSGIASEIAGGILLNNRARMSALLFYARGTVENNERLRYNTIYYDFWYFDASIIGIGMGPEFVVITRKPFQGTVAAHLLWGTGRVRIGYGSRPDEMFGDYGEDNYASHGLGLGIEGTLAIFPVERVSVGVTVGYHYLRTAMLRNTFDGTVWQRPPNDPHYLDLDFGGLRVRGSITAYIPEPEGAKKKRGDHSAAP